MVLFLPLINTARLVAPVALMVIKTSIQAGVLCVAACLKQSTRPEKGKLVWAEELRAMPACFQSDVQRLIAKF